jgi:hypothetical protein
MRLGMSRRTALAAVAVISTLALAGVAVAQHELQYVDDQTYSSGNWIWWRTGFSWDHNDDLHFKGYAANGGSPSAGGTFDGISAYDWAAASCNNGLTWPYWSTNTNPATNSNFVEVETAEVFMPSCSSSPKYRSSSSHLWEDGAWSTGKNKTWDQ